MADFWLLRDREREAYYQISPAIGSASVFFPRGDVRPSVFFSATIKNDSLEDRIATALVKTRDIN